MAGIIVVHKKRMRDPKYRKVFKALEKEFSVAPAPTVPAKVRCPATYDHDETLTADEAKKVRHAIKQARERKTTSWSQVKHEQGL